MSNFKVQFHDETASVNEKGAATYTEVYMVVAPKNTRASAIISGASDASLPTYKSKLNNVPVSSINVDRWTQSNVKDLGGFTSASVWKYTVVYSKSSSSTDENVPPWELDYAQNCTISPKSYTEHTNKTLRVTNASGTALPYIEQNKKILTNAIGEHIYRDVEVLNQVLSFDYAVKRYNINTNCLYVGSVNYSDITVAGITIPSGKGRLLSLVPSSQVWEDGTEYTQVHVEIELSVYKSVFKDYVIGNSRYAVPAYRSTPYPIQMLSCAVEDIADYEGVLWFNKDRKLGFFGEAKKGKLSLNPSLYSYVSEEFPLNKDGTMYIGTRDPTTGRYIIDMDDPNLDKVETTDSYILTWKTIGFPKKGFKDA